MAIRKIMMLSFITVFLYVGSAAALDFSVDGFNNAGPISEFNNRAISTGLLPAGDYRISIVSGAIAVTYTSCNITAISFRIGEESSIHDLGILGQPAYSERYWGDGVCRTVVSDAFDAYLSSGNTFQNITLQKPAEILFYFIDNLYGDYRYDNSGALVVRVEPVVASIAIDIKPGSSSNSINPRSYGKVPVAILSFVTFDASIEVDKTSLTFGRTGVESSLAFCNDGPEDVNNDGLSDLMCHFYTQSTAFQSGNTQGVLKGRTVSGVNFNGTDSVSIVPIK